MGCIVACIKKSNGEDRYLFKDKIIFSVNNISSDMPIVETSTSSSLSLQQITPTHFRTEFNWSKIQSIYLGCSNMLDDDLNLTLPMVATVHKVFYEIEKNLVSNAKKIFFCTTFLGQRFRNKFESYSHISDNDFRFKTTDDRILAHVISYIKFHQLLLYSFERNIHDAKKLLHLLALSHLVMKVTQLDFRLLDIALEKFLLKFNLVDEHTLKVTISYLNLITNYLHKCIGGQKDRSLVNRIINNTDNMAVDRKRDSMRDLRKWKKLISRLRLETCPFVEEAIETSHHDLQPSKSLRFKLTCPLAGLHNISIKSNDDINKAT